MENDPRQYFFASDLHGDPTRYGKLFTQIEKERPRAVLLGGDLLPMFSTPKWDGAVDGQEFIRDYLEPEFSRLRTAMGRDYPDLYLILGNDDLLVDEPNILEGERRGIWHYAHSRRLKQDDFSVYGYAFVPPTPFQQKDWERYDISRYVDPGCVSPEEGRHSVPQKPALLRYASIQKDLQKLAGSDDLSRAIFLFHSPPYKTLLDRADLDGQFVDHVPVDPHVGSIAIQRFIESRQPLLTLHGHVHESSRLTGSWRDMIGGTHSFQGSHDGPELALIRFDPNRLQQATRVLI